MPDRASLTTSFKRGALIAAANWPVTIIQFIGESTLKLLLTVPVIGGAVLVALALGRDLREIFSGDFRDAFAAVASALVSHPVALAAFLISLSLVLFGGSTLLFLVKGGTVTVLAESERLSGPIEQPSLRLATFWRASQFSTDRFTSGCTRLFRRYLRLGLMLIAVYGVLAILYLVAVFLPFQVITRAAFVVLWTVVAGMLSVLLVFAITLINLYYLLVQIAVATDDSSVRAAFRRVGQFLRSEPRQVFTIFLIVLGLVVLATIVSVLATAGLGLIAFVPLVGLIALPLQVAAWLFRGLVFEYLGMTALVVYVKLYREFTHTYE